MDRRSFKTAWSDTIFRENEVSTQFAWESQCEALAAPHSLRWLAAGVSVIPISVCMTVRNTCSCKIGMVNESSTLSNASEVECFHRCWKFRWTNSPLLNLIQVDQLLAFEPFLVSAIYSTFVGKTYHRALDITLHIDSLPCMLLNNDTEEALTLLLSWVSWHPPPIHAWMPYEGIISSSVHCSASIAHSVLVYIGILYQFTKGLLP